MARKKVGHDDPVDHRGSLVERCCDLDVLYKKQIEPEHIANFRYLALNYARSHLRGGTTANSGLEVRYFDCQ